MIKGKSIQNTTDVNQFEIKNTIKTSAPALMPKKIINSTSSYDPIIESNVDKELYYTKSIVSNSNKQETIKRSNNIRYSVAELKIRFAGFSTLHYQEIFDLLECTDFEINERNLNSNLMKFINLGNNVQSHISKLNNVLKFLPSTSFEKIKEQHKSKFSFFSSNSDIQNIFNEFNSEVFNLYNTLSIEITQIKNLDFNKYNLINLYFNFFKFIADEIKNKQIVPDEVIDGSVIASRVISLNNSISVLNQFKTLIQLEIQARDLELNNLKDYLDVLKPSLSLLERQDFKKFKEKFKEVLN